MKTLNKTDILLKALDLELKAILKKDLQNFKAQQQAKINEAAFIQLLAA
jgi:hypothetical protein